MTACGKRHAIGANYGAYYYSVESPGAIGYSLNVHAYLHHFINSLVETNWLRQRKKLETYFKAGKSGAMARSYQEDVTFTYECLVRALDGRIEIKMHPELTGRVEARIADETARGLTLTRPFYDMLSQFENSNLPFDRFLPVLLDRLPEYSPPRPETASRRHI